MVNQDRNAEMISQLVKKNVKGALLFFIEDGDKPNFILPPGLTDKQIALFREDFFIFFSKYSKMALENQQ